MDKYNIIEQGKIPDKATMSLGESPWAWNVLIRLVRLEVGGGITPVLAAVKFAVLESLLPTFTFQNGPPSCTNKSHSKILIVKVYEDIYIYIYMVEFNSVK